MENKVYICECSNIIDLINQIDVFSERMKGFIMKHSNYRYTIKIDKVDKKKWQVELNVIKNDK